MKRLDHILYVFLLLAVAACTENDCAVACTVQAITATISSNNFFIFFQVWDAKIRKVESKTKDFNLFYAETKLSSTL